MNTAAIISRGREIYNYRCYFCHGYSGDAKTLAGTFLNPVPRAFTKSDPAVLTRDKMLKAVRQGIPKSAMMSFAQTLKDEDIAAVVDFVRATFMAQQKPNTRYHTEANGWQNHQRYKAAFPFVLGEISLTTPWESLTVEQQQGRQLFMSSCVSCHDHVEPNTAPLTFEPLPLSYPRDGYSPQTGQRLDAISSATPYARHDTAPEIRNITAQQKRGEAMYQHNCAFCHAMDGTGKNWIGQFLQPHPRDFTSFAQTRHLDPVTMSKAIQHGVVGTAMPAWKQVMSTQQIDDITQYIQRAFIPHQALGVINDKHR